ncbi:hypothetical protein [Cohnella hongkongensis]|uniref:ABC transporter permease n=1 Tax=Cohnella hongkongensis TaxID=178337 RepID=A0ABV9FKZ6_9BACL
MLRMQRLLLAIAVSSFVNRLVYYIRRLPLIGPKVPESLYAGLSWKRGAAVAGLLLGIVWSAAVQLAYVGLFVYWPVKASGVETLPAFLSVLLVLSFLVGPIVNARVMETKRSKFVAVKLLRLPPATYMRSTLAYRYTVFFMAFVPALVLFVPLAGGSPLDGALIALALVGWRVVAEFVHLLVFQKTGIVLIKQNLFVWLSLLAGVALAYGPLLLDDAPRFGIVLTAYPFVLALALLGAGAAVLLARYPDYAEAVDAAVKRDDPLLNLGQVMSDARKADVVVKAGDYKSADIEEAPQSAIGERLRGYARLNALFFQRHRRFIRKPLVNRLIGICGAAAAAALLAASVGAPEGWTLSTLLPFLPFGLYSLAIGERFCRAIFYNCDLPLLRYAFYREAAVRHFAIRLKRLGGMNLLLGTALGAALTAVAAAAGWPLDAGLLLPMWIAVLALCWLFSVHHLLLYYLLQPYTPEMNAKNPLFFTLNIAVSALCWITLVAKPGPVEIAAGTAVLAAVYSAAALLLVRRYGPNAFRLK